MDDIKPVAYIDDDGEAVDAGMIDWYRGNYGETNSVVARYKHACYPQSAIDALQAEVERLEEYADDYRDAIGDLVSQLVRAEERIKHLELAANRYWWLKDEATHYDGNGAKTPWIVIGTDGGNARPLYGDDIDSMIDNILKEQG